MRRAILPPVAAACLLVCVGCGGRGGLYPVSGKVLHKGGPAVGATVTFVRKGATDRLEETAPQGVVQEDGTFTLSGPLGEGAPPGEYAVLVEWKQGAGKRRGRSPGLSAPDRLKGRYLNPARQLLTATVEAMTNNLAPFELN